MDHACRLGHEQTDAEARLWTRLRNHQLGAKFRRQHRAEGFVLDFACVEHALAVELDGGHHSERALEDEQRTQRLEGAGWRVIRFWNNQALAQTDDVVAAIWAALQQSPPHPNPLPRRRGRGGNSQGNSQGNSHGNSQNNSQSNGNGPINRLKHNALAEVRRAAADQQHRSQDGLAASAPSPPLAGERAEVRGASAPSASIGTLRLRARLNARLRGFFAERNVTELETPVLSQAGNTDPNIASFSLHFSGRTDGASPTRWLRTSPEFALKRLLAAGFGDCYELGRVFRDGEAGVRHNPEFTMLEWYREGWDHRALMIETATLVNAALELVGRKAAYCEIRYADLYRRHLGIDPESASDDELRRLLGEVQIDPVGLTRDDWLDLLMTHRLQPDFPKDQLLAVYDYPASQCALARLRTDADGTPVAERFELYLGSLELANGYHELADPVEQGARFDRDRGVREQRGQVAPPRDERLLAALAAGLPDCAGVALGVDRLLMAMLGTDRIGDVLAFDFARS